MSLGFILINQCLYQITPSGLFTNWRRLKVMCLRKMPSSCIVGKESVSGAWPTLGTKCQEICCADFDNSLSSALPKNCGQMIQLYIMSRPKNWHQQIKSGIFKNNMFFFLFSFCSYTPVYNFVSSFLNEADKQDGRAAAIMRLGAAEDFIRHFSGYTHTHCSTSYSSWLGVFAAFIISVYSFSSVDMILYRGYIVQSPMANAAQAKLVLLRRYTHTQNPCFVLPVANSFMYLPSSPVCVFAG